ncbi:hypothetical protein Dda_0787 [Drechslerella dactyloides]|uniref:Uncharacterized protein n=1 Tax=Drechslerella dactyloides TaxID=74499 RepID=A0AAD6NPB1_DREDA|nr:hypothetical protein Dda_0787 [Drechslerella dactyloides]
MSRGSIPRSGAVKLLVIGGEGFVEMLGERGRPGLRFRKVPSMGERNHPAAYVTAAGVLWFEAASDAIPRGRPSASSASEMEERTEADEEEEEEEEKVARSGRETEMEMGDVYVRAGGSIGG